MKKPSWIFLFVSTLSLLSLNTSAISVAQEYEPSVGQQGKDVIWVPTPNSLIDAMLGMAEVTPADYVIDLGSGDGRIVIAAAKIGAKALGIEYNPDMVELSRRNAEKEGVSDRASFSNADIFESDFSNASVITMYLLPNLNLKLRPTLLELKPGTRIVSHAFTMGEWEADQTVSSEGRTAYLWIVPAKVDGLWTWQEGSETVTLRLTQNFQKIEGTVTAKENSWPILNAKLNGGFIEFALGDKYYSGKAGTDRIEGDVESQNGKLKWTAARDQ
jgi:SAM-dependent methyltransferase